MIKVLSHVVWGNFSDPEVSELNYLYIKAWSHVVGVRLSDSGLGYFHNTPRSKWIKWNDAIWVN